MVNTQAPWNQLEALARCLSPTGEALRGKIPESDIVRADETRWRRMPGKSSKRRQSWRRSSCIPRKISLRPETVRVPRQFPTDVLVKSFRALLGLVGVDYSNSARFHQTLRCEPVAIMRR